MDKCERLNKQYTKAAEALQLQEISTVRVTLPQVYHLDTDVVTVDNIWWLLLIQFTMTSEGMYHNSVLLNKADVLNIKPLEYAGMPVLDAVAQIVTDKLRNS